MLQYNSLTTVSAYYGQYPTPGLKPHTIAINQLINLCSRKTGDTSVLGISSRIMACIRDHPLYKFINTQ